MQNNFRVNSYDTNAILLVAEIADRSCKTTNKKALYKRGLFAHGPKEDLFAVLI